MGRRIAVLGSTGSIGRQALEVIQGSPELELHSIVCRSSLKKLDEQRNRYSPAFAGAATRGSHRETILKALEGCDMALNAIVGSAGLQASLVCQEMGLPLALANKESLVIGSELLTDHLRKGLVIPVDSEHSTISGVLWAKPAGPEALPLPPPAGPSGTLTRLTFPGPHRKWSLITPHGIWAEG